MKLLLKSLVLLLGLAAASPALAFSYSCADWKDPNLRADFWREATRATIADCVQDMGFAMGFSVKDRDDGGATPLHYAAAFSNPDVIIALIEAGADVNAAIEDGRTPLHAAASENSNPDVITALLEAGADGSTKNNDGKTPYHLAGDNEFIKNTEAFWALNDARFK
jgi:hypothetical protein